MSGNEIGRFVDAVNSVAKRVAKTKRNTTYGTVVSVGDKVRVRLDGSTLSTPATSSVSVSKGDRVELRVENHSVAVTSNISDIAATASTVNDLADQIDEVQSQLDELGDEDTDLSDIEESLEDLADAITDVSSVIPTVTNAEYQYYNSTSKTALEGGEWGEDPDYNNYFVWRRLVITNSDGTVTYGEPECLSSSLDLTGNGVAGVLNHYAVSDDGDNEPGEEEFSTDFPSLNSTYPYLWSYETVTYSDGTVSDTSKRVIAVYGSFGKAGRTITAITEWYLVSDKNDEITWDDPAWGTSVPTTSVAQPYLWNYEEVSYTDGTAYTSNPAIIGTYTTRGTGWFYGTALDGTEDGYEYSGPTLTDTYIVGDMYLNTETGNVYVCVVAGVGSDAYWNYQTTITGSTWTAGAGEPEETDGFRTGDMYLDTETGDIYRFNGNSWALATNITGEPGSAVNDVVLGTSSFIVPCTYAGYSKSAQTVQVYFGGYTGSERVAASVAVSGLPSGITLYSSAKSTTTSDGYIVLKVAANSALGSTSTYSGTITLAFAIDGQTIYKYVTWAKSLSGTNGTNGTNGTDGTDGRDGTDGGTFYGTCSSSSSTSTKVVTLQNTSGYSRTNNMTVAVSFVYANTASTPYLSVNGYAGRIMGGNIYWSAGSIVLFTYYNGYWYPSSSPVYASTVTVGNSNSQHIYMDSSSLKIMTNSSNTVCALGDNGIVTYKAGSTTPVFGGTSDGLYGVINTGYGSKSVVVGNNDRTTVNFYYYDIKDYSAGKTIYLPWYPVSVAKITLPHRGLKVNGWNINPGSMETTSPILTVTVTTNGAADSWSGGTFNVGVQLIYIKRALDATFDSDD